MFWGCRILSMLLLRFSLTFPAGKRGSYNIPDEVTSIGGQKLRAAL